MGIFAEYQGIYAEHGIATFPVNIIDGQKKPAVSGYMRITPERSRALVAKFGESHALGLVAGKATGITGLDVDTTDERVLADALDRHGQSPLVVQTARGKWHVYYQHNGEPRRIRPWGEDLPIDVLGGGFMVAPPSQAGSSAYRIVQGSLADLHQLPVMRGLDGIPTLSARARARTEQAEHATDRVSEGKRNDTLWQYCMRHAAHCDDLDQLIDVANTFSATFEPPLAEVELIRTAASAWDYEQRGENWFGRGRRVVSTHTEIDGLLMEHPDAYVLLTVLRRHHWNRDFVVANGMHETMPGGGWPEKRFAKARAELIRRGLIVLVRAASTLHGAALYRWPDTGAARGQGSSLNTECPVSYRSSFLTTATGIPPTAANGEASVEGLAA